MYSESTGGAIDLGPHTRPGGPECPHAGEMGPIMRIRFVRPLVLVAGGTLRARAAKDLALSPPGDDWARSPVRQSESENATTGS